MKESIQSVFLAFVFLIVLLSGCAPDSTPVPSTSAWSLEGTVWVVEADSDGDSYKFEFLSNGIVNYIPPLVSPTNGTWKQDGNTVYFEINNFTENIGVINGNTMTGTASNKNGQTWTWTAKRQ